MTASSTQLPRRVLDRGVCWALLGQLATVTALVAGYYLLPLERVDRPRTLLVLTFGVLGVVTLAVWQVRAIMRSARPVAQAMQALASAVPLYLVTFATAYYLLDWHQPGSFTQRLGRTDALYLTMVVFTTVGFGDITPASQLARITVMIQLVGNVLVIGVLVRVLTSAVRLRHGERTAASSADTSPTDTSDGPEEAAHP